MKTRDTSPSFTLGIEEEYMLIDPSGALTRRAPRGLMPALKRKLGDAVTPEFMQAQIEICTSPHNTVGQLRDQLGELRAAVGEVAAQHDLAIIAAATHPFANPYEQAVTDCARYAQLAADLQGVVRRLLIGGMHVHVGIDDDDLRIELMNQTRSFLPHLLALSTSSPFWQGHDTGLKSYRIAVWDAMPRAGLPPAFDGAAAYAREVDALVQAGVIEDATKIWWDLRPSARYPTLEMRIADVCTTIDDAVCIAALYQCWLRFLYRRRNDNQRRRVDSTWLLDENRWRAHRYGIDCGLIDFDKGEIIDCREWLEEILRNIAEDADALDCAAEVRHARTILRRGTSAHRQLRLYQDAIEQGQTRQQALAKVVQWLRKETLRV